ncbi:MFS transporter [Bartonella sp. DGB2]|uniref:MFS transporter n=1 Tax=Bartonella sp. DGB2 TaxID=3388426 RepID=UPI00398FB100
MYKVLLIWTTVPVFLMSDLFHFSQGQIALFALAGAAGVFAAPIAGRLADRGVLRFATLLALFLVALCFILSYFAFAPFVLGGSLWGAGFLVIAAISLDFGVTTNLIIGQKIIYSLGAEMRGRLNGLYMVVFFIGGAIGSASGGLVYSLAGWGGTCLLGFIIVCITGVYFLTEKG